jgi:XRE family transcriptional regulator, regulator of sulfur utilization
MAVMTTQPRRCCCGYLYSDREGYYCPKGNRLLCEECATRGAGVCPTHKSLVHGEKRLTAPRTGIALGPMTGRAAKRVRKVLGPRLRALRKQRALSQERLGKRSGLSGKFIGEVERGEKSISLNSSTTWRSRLGFPLRDLTDIGDKHTVSTEEAEKIFALVSRWRRPEDVRKAYNVLRAMFSRAS